MAETEALTGSCEDDCQVRCAYPGQFTECDTEEGSEDEPDVRALLAEIERLRAENERLVRGDPDLRTALAYTAGYEDGGAERPRSYSQEDHA